ncbi:hypothetical protein KDA_16010 [Dictyobacter alpinus]|uniref:Uncharacterized protein n=1 Tax=Dictyobacter alpinus TaxID=2014873 RepID=A0A402B478_9CHLR|nr:hypothetical protein [Dictyobacter alpinus]GCE26117.1 hypothetical protein KDA_16010 [Dictyobacter alpinus]
MHESSDQDTFTTNSSFLTRLRESSVAFPFKGLFHSGPGLVPVPVRLHGHGRDPEPARFQMQPSLLSLAQAWLRYQRIQLQWDIERRIARWLHRRWGN